MSEGLGPPPSETAGLEAYTSDTRPHSEFTSVRSFERKAPRVSRRLLVRNGAEALRQAVPTEGNPPAPDDISRRVRSAVEKVRNLRLERRSFLRGAGLGVALAGVSVARHHLPNLGPTDTGERALPTPVPESTPAQALAPSPESTPVQSLPGPETAPVPETDRVSQEMRKKEWSYIDWHLKEFLGRHLKRESFLPNSKSGFRKLMDPVIKHVETVRGELSRYEVPLDSALGKTILGICLTENGGGEDLTSKSGAVGIMQLMPVAARDIESTSLVRRVMDQMQKKGIPVPDTDDWRKVPQINIAGGVWLFMRNKGFLDKYITESSQVNGVSLLAEDLSAAVTSYHSGAGAVKTMFERYSKDIITNPDFTYANKAIGAFGVTLLQKQEAFNYSKNVLGDGNQEYNFRVKAGAVICGYMLKDPQRFSAFLNTDVFKDRVTSFTQGKMQIQEVFKEFA